MERLVEFMPVPIKSLQSVPIPASYVFRDLRISQPGFRKGSKRNNLTDDIDNEENMMASLAKDIASEVYGYSESTDINDLDDLEESRLLDEGLQDLRHTSCVKSIDLCSKVDDLIVSESKSVEINNSAKKVTSTALNEYNQRLVDNHEDDDELLLKNLQHERLYKMTKNNDISRERSLWQCLDHYAEDRSQEIERLDGLVENRNRLERVADSNYDEIFLNNYFDEDLS